MRFIFTILFSAYVSVTVATAQDGGQFFETNIRPLIAKQCQACHSASAAMGGLRLDTRENLLKGGAHGAVVVPGKPGESLLLRAVSHTGDLKMPPSGKLKDAEIALLGQWIQMNAPWGNEKPSQAKSAQKFWAFVPAKEPVIPVVKNSAWVKSPIDAFVLNGLVAKGLTPAPAADKRTLIRRATFDLTGLPPTPEEVKSFFADQRPEAFRDVVNRLLASPRYGERWGRHWLDVARYADSNGLDENLVYRHAYRYRDYVIQAFNKDKPYDLFLKEQLAGDLLPGVKDETTQFERWTATGFLSLGAKMLAEDDPMKMEMDIVDEQLDTTARTFMGMTVGCARCHDHKFDPIPTADYYSMAGIFKSSKTMENFKVVATWHEYILAPEQERQKLKEHLEKITAKSKEMGSLSGKENNLLVTVARTKVGAYLLAAGDVLRYEKMHLKPVLGGNGVLRTADSFERGNAPKKLEKEKSNVPTGSKGPYFAEFDVTVEQAGNYQLDMLEEETGAGTADVWVNGVLEMRGKGPVTNREASPDAGGWSVSGIFPLLAGKNVVRLEHKSRFPYFESLQLHALAKGSEVPLSSQQVARQYEVNPSYLGQWVEELRRDKGAPNSVLYALFAYGENKGLEAWLSPAAARFKDFHPKSREELAAHYQQLFNEADGQWQQVLKARKDQPKVKAERNAVQQEEGLPDAILEAFRSVSYAKAGAFSAPTDAKQYYPQAIQDQLAALAIEKKKLEEATPDLPKAMGVTEGDKIANIPIHLRGSHWTLGEEVPRQFLRVVAGENQKPISDKESGRLQFAEWLTKPDHPLTSRVMANRIWRWHFGKGIVPSVDNFGRLGEMPTNQPLLDWLSLRFVEANWSMKEMHRLIMLSNSYQMSSNYNEHAAELDPENTLLWRMSRQRLESEEIRDGVTAVTGEIDLKVGGTVLSYKDRDYVANTSRRGGIDYDNPRRAVYIPMVRSSMYEMFTAFDLPDPSSPNGDRNATVIAPQALFMMNSTLVLKSTRAMAQRLLLRTDLDDSARIRDAYERALARPPAARDVDRALTFIAQIEKAMEGQEKDAEKRHLFAWQSFCKALFASNEFIYLN